MPLKVSYINPLIDGKVGSACSSWVIAGAEIQRIVKISATLKNDLMELSPLGTKKRIAEPALNVRGVPRQFVGWLTGDDRV